MNLKKNKMFLGLALGLTTITAAGIAVACTTQETADKKALKELSKTLTENKTYTLASVTTKAAFDKTFEGATGDLKAKFSGLLDEATKKTFDTAMGDAKYKGVTITKVESEEKEGTDTAKTKYLSVKLTLKLNSDTYTTETPLKVNYFVAKTTEKTPAEKETDAKTALDGKTFTAQNLADKDVKTIATELTTKEKLLALLPDGTDKTNLTTALTGIDLMITTTAELNSFKVMVTKIGTGTGDLKASLTVNYTPEQKKSYLDVVVLPLVPATGMVPAPAEGAEAPATSTVMGTLTDAQVRTYLTLTSFPTGVTFEATVKAGSANDTDGTLVLLVKVANGDVKSKEQEVTISGFKATDQQAALQKQVDALTNLTNVTLAEGQE